MTGCSYVGPMNYSTFTHEKCNLVFDKSAVRSFEGSGYCPVHLPLAYDETNSIWTDRPLAQNAAALVGTSDGARERDHHRSRGAKLFARDNLSQMEFSLSERASIYPIPGAIVRSPVRLSSRILRGLDLRGSKFLRQVSLIELSFKGRVHLSSSVFCKVLLVKDRIFDDEVSFYEALFHGYVIFVNVRIAGFAQFRRSVFNSRSAFDDVHFAKAG